MIIKHKSWKDVAFEVLHEHPNGWVYGNWINLGYTKSWYIPHDPQGVKLDDSGEWLKCGNVTERCLRNSRWISL